MKQTQETLEPEKYYHIYNRGNNNEKLFLCEDNYIFFLKKFGEHILSIADIFAYCLLPNHFHFLIKIKNEQKIIIERDGIFTKDVIYRAISEPFRKLFISYTMAFNKQQNRYGNLFQRPYKRIEVTDENYFICLIHYIHRNPIHHKLCLNYTDWKHSSYHTFLSDKPTKIMRDEVLEWFGNKREFIRFHNENIEYHKIEKLLIE